MQYRRLGDAGVKISEIGLGGWLTFGNAIEQQQARDVMDAAFDRGINFFDSANAYARGKSEEAWGELLAGRPRSSYVLATKVFFPMGEGPNDRGLSRKHVMEQCHASLRRLKTDYIDLYWLHAWDMLTPVEEVVSTLDELVRAGKVRYVGLSDTPAWYLARAQTLAELRGSERFCALQLEYSLVERNIEREHVPAAIELGMGICP